MTTVFLAGASVSMAWVSVHAARPRPRRPWAPGPTRSVGPVRGMIAAWLLVVASLVVAGPVATVLVAAGVTIGRWWRGRRAVARRAAEQGAAIVDVIELVALSLRGGTAPLSVLAEIADDVPPALVEAVSESVRALADGVPMRRAVEPLRRSCGDGHGGRLAGSLCDLLVRGVHDGVQLADPALALARRARDDERRRLEAQARRLPVVLLAPMFLCLVPAFLLLVVVPMLIVGVRALAL